MPKHINKQPGPGGQYVAYLPKDIVEELGWIPTTRDAIGTELIVEREGSRVIIRKYQPVRGSGE